MKAMILAAGLGKRMRPLTDNLPKPLLMAGGKSLIEHQLLRLKNAGITEVVINLAYLGEKIQQALKDGSQWGMQLHYSHEPEPLETAGAIQQALPILGRQPFLLLNADVWCDLDLSALVAIASQLDHHGHLVLVENPGHNQQGDFALAKAGLLQLAQAQDTAYTYSGIAVLQPEIISQYPRQRPKYPLREVFEHSIAQGRLSAEVYRGDWRDIGTPERLAQLDKDLQARQ